MDTYTEDDYSKAHAPTVGIIMACLLFLMAGLATLNTKRYLDYRKMDQNGSVTTGEIIKKIRTPQDHNRRHYAFVYKYENPSVETICARSEKHFTTPQDQACKTSFRLHSIVKDQYNKIQLGDKVDVLYLPDSQHTESTVIGEYAANKSYVVKALLALLGLLFSVHLTIKLFRTF